MQQEIPYRRRRGGIHPAGKVEIDCRCANFSVDERHDAGIGRRHAHGTVRRVTIRQAEYAAAPCCYVQGVSAEVKRGWLITGIHKSKRMCGIENGVRSKRQRTQLGGTCRQPGTGVGQRASVGDNLVRVRPCAVADVKHRARRHADLRIGRTKQLILRTGCKLDRAAEDVRSARILLAGLRRNERSFPFLHQLDVSVERDRAVRVRHACGDVQVEFAHIIVEVFQLHQFKKMTVVLIRPIMLEKLDSVVTVGR